MKFEFIFIKIVFLYEILFLNCSNLNIEDEANSFQKHLDLYLTELTQKKSIDTYLQNNVIKHSVSCPKQIYDKLVRELDDKFAKVKRTLYQTKTRIESELAGFHGDAYEKELQCNYGGRNCSLIKLSTPIASYKSIILNALSDHSLDGIPLHPYFKTADGDLIHHNWNLTTHHGFGIGNSNFGRLNLEKTSQSFSVIIVDLVAENNYDSLDYSRVKNLTNDILKLHGHLDKVWVIVLLEEHLENGSKSKCNLIQPTDPPMEFRLSGCNNNSYEIPVDKHNKSIMIEMSKMGSAYIEKILSGLFSQGPNGKSTTIKNCLKQLFHLAYDILLRTMNQELEPFTGQSYIHYLTNRARYPKTDVMELADFISRYDNITGFYIVINGVLLVSQNRSQIRNPNQNSLGLLNIEAEKFIKSLIKNQLQNIDENAEKSENTNANVGTYLIFELGSDPTYIGLSQLLSNGDSEMQVSITENSIDFSLFCIESSFFKKSVGNKKIYGLLGINLDVKALYQKYICSTARSPYMLPYTGGYQVFLTDLDHRYLWNPLTACKDFDLDANGSSGYTLDLTFYFRVQVALSISDAMKNSYEGQIKIAVEDVSDAFYQFNSSMSLRWKKIDDSQFVLGFIVLDAYASGPFNCTDESNFFKLLNASAYVSYDNHIRGHYYDLEQLINYEDSENNQSSYSPNVRSLLRFVFRNQQNATTVKTKKKFQSDAYDKYVVRKYMTIQEVGSATAIAINVPTTLKPFNRKSTDQGFFNIKETSGRDLSFLALNQHFFLKPQPVYNDGNIAIHFQAFNLDPLGMGRIASVTYRAPNGGNDLVVKMGLDITPGWLAKVLLDSVPSCASVINGKKLISFARSGKAINKCFLMNERGYILIHTDDLGNRPLAKKTPFTAYHSNPKFDHVAHREPGLFLNYLLRGDSLNHDGRSQEVLQKNSCYDLAALKVKTFYVPTQNAAEDLNNSKFPRVSACKGGEIRVIAMSGTNLYLVVVLGGTVKPYEKSASKRPMSNSIETDAFLNVTLTNEDEQEGEGRFCNSSSTLSLGQGVPIFCPCSRFDDACFDCERDLTSSDFVKCECPCQCPLKIPTAAQKCPLDLDLIKLPPCYPYDLGTGDFGPHRSLLSTNSTRLISLAQRFFSTRSIPIFGSQLEKNFATGLSQNSDWWCSKYRTPLDCYGVVDCQWCQVERDGNTPLTGEFCARQHLCYGGILGAPSPYSLNRSEYEARSRHYSSYYNGDPGVGESDNDYTGTNKLSQFTPDYKGNANKNKVPVVAIVGGIAGCGFCVALVVYLYRSTAASSTRLPHSQRALYNEQMDTPNNDNLEDCQPSTSKNFHGSHDHSAFGAHTTISPYQINSTYQKGCNVGSDHGYSTMTAPDDSEIASSSVFSGSEASSAFKRKGLPSTNAPRKTGPPKLGISIFTHKKDLHLTKFDDKGAHFHHAERLKFHGLGTKLNPVASSQYYKYKENFLKDLKLSGKIIFTDIEEEMPVMAGADKSLDATQDIMPTSTEETYASLPTKTFSVPVQFHRNFEGL